MYFKPENVFKRIALTAGIISPASGKGLFFLPGVKYSLGSTFAVFGRLKSVAIFWLKLL